MSVYSQYFQKSKVFLYPLLQFRKGLLYVPVESFICWNPKYSMSDAKFLCLYVAERNDKFTFFEKDLLFSHPLFEKYYNLDNKHHLYIFNYQKYKNDVEHFKEGHYSKFDVKTKNIILNFFGNAGVIANHINTYLHPDKYHKLYSEELEVSLDIIVENHELCDKPDLIKETFDTNFYKKYDLSKTNSISLTSQIQYDKPTNRRKHDAC